MRLARSGMPLGAQKNPGTLQLQKSTRFQGVLFGRKPEKISSSWDLANISRLYRYNYQTVNRRKVGQNSLAVQFHSNAAKENLIFVPKIHLPFEIAPFDRSRRPHKNHIFRREKKDNGRMNRTFLLGLWRVSRLWLNALRLFLTRLGKPKWRSLANPEEGIPPPLVHSLLLSSTKKSIRAPERKPPRPISF